MTASEVAFVSALSTGMAVATMPVFGVVSIVV
jgi:hypothetical protein